mgnify:CR=1 FL=1
MRIRFGKRFKLPGGTYMSISTGIGGKKRRKTKKEEEESDAFWGMIFSWILKLSLLCAAVAFFWIPGPFLALYYSKKLEGEERTQKIKRVLVFSGISLGIFLISIIYNYASN